jgi:hypothetical protein
MSAALGSFFVVVVTPGLVELNGVISELLLGSKIILRWLASYNIAYSGGNCSPKW